MMRNPHIPKAVLFSFLLMVSEMPAAAVHRVVHHPCLAPSSNSGACVLCEGTLYLPADCSVFLSRENYHRSSKFSEDKS